MPPFNTRAAKTALMTVLMAVLAGLSLISLWNAWQLSQDFQWSGARLLLAGRNPFEVYLGEDRRAFFIKSQAPNYLHIFYVILAPFAMLPAAEANLAWGVTNLAMLVFSCHSLLRLFGQPVRSHLPWLTLLVLSGFPGRNAIGNGQAAIFVMATLVAGLRIVQLDGAAYRSGWRQCWGWMVYGLCYVKYSFLPAFAMFAVVSFTWTALILTLVPAAAGALGVAALFHDPAVIFQPLQVSSRTMATSYGIGDLLSLINASAGGLGSRSFQMVSLACIALSAVPVVIARNLPFERRLAVATVASLMFVSHLGYDYILMAVVLAFACTPSATRLDRFAIGVSWGWIGYGYRLLWAYGVSPTRLILPTFLLNVFLLEVLLRPCWKKGWSHEADGCKNP